MILTVYKTKFPGLEKRPSAEEYFELKYISLISNIFIF